MAKDIKYEKTRGDIPNNGKKRTIGKKRVPQEKRNKKGSSKSTESPTPLQKIRHTNQSKNKARQ